MMKSKLLLISLSSLLVGGCVYVGPIEEEVDSLPYFNEFTGVNPSMGFVEVDLSSGGTQEFTLKDYGDDNEYQTLYHRMVVDYRAAGLTSNPISAVSPKAIEPGRRESIYYTFPACSLPKPYSDVLVDGKTIDLYLILSDDEFSYQNQNPTQSFSDFSFPFETVSGRGGVWVHWTVRFTGSCHP